MSRRTFAAWLPPALHCHCNGEGRRPNTVPLRVFSTFAAQMRHLAGGLTAEVGTWRCGRCGKVHTVTAAHLGFGATEPCAPSRPA